jgi:hypothetical protein
MWGILLLGLSIAVWIGISVGMKRWTSSNVVAFGGGFIIFLLGFGLIGGAFKKFEERRYSQQASAAGFSTIEQYEQAQRGGYKTKSEFDRAMAMRAEEERQRKEAMRLRSNQPAVVRSSSGNAQNRFGMSQEHYDRCKTLGSRVMAAQRRQPDSPEHKSAFAEWDRTCGMAVMLKIYRETGISLRSLPTTPLEWSRL